MNEGDIRRAASKIPAGVEGDPIVIVFPVSCNICRMTGENPVNYATLEEFQDHLRQAHG